MSLHDTEFLIASLRDHEKQLNDLRLELSTIKSQKPTPTPTRRQVIKALFTNAEFSSHGIAHVLNASNLVSRLTWLLVLVTFFTCCSIQVFDNLSSYFSYQVISNVRIHDTRQLTFPAFIVCTWESELAIDKAIFHCTFNNNLCHSDLFEKVVVPGHGLSAKHYCFRINSSWNKKAGQLLTVSDTDLFNSGLSISFLMPDDNVEVYYALFDNPIVGHSGELKNLALPGDIHFVTITKILLDKLGAPYNDCAEEVNNRITKELASRGSAYSRSICYRVCRLYFIERQCACSLAYQLWSTGQDTCEPDCVSMALKKSEYEKECDELCPVICDSAVLELNIEKQEIKKMSYFVGLAKKYFNQSGNYTFEFVVDKLRILNMNFKQMQYTEISEMPKTIWPSLVGELGGTIGKF